MILDRVGGGFDSNEKSDLRRSTISATDGSWHHICATWNSVTGSWQLLKNGVIVAAGQDLQRGRTFPSQSNHYIDADVRI